MIRWLISVIKKVFTKKVNTIENPIIRVKELYDSMPLMERQVADMIAEKILPKEIEQLKKSVVRLEDLLEEKMKVNDAWLCNRIRQVLQSTRNTIIAYEHRLEVFKGEKNETQIQVSKEGLEESYEKSSLS